MSALLDHLTALAVGTVVLVALLSLQTRDRLAAVEGATNDVAERQVAALAETLSEEFENVLSGPTATAALGTARFRLERDAANERTSVVEVPAYVRATPGAVPAPGHVRYTLTATGRTVRVGSRQLATYRLARAVDLGSGYGRAAVVGDGIVDFDVKFRGKTDERFVGVPPVGFAQIAFQAVVAVPPPRAGAGGAPTRTTNRARAAATVRPANLTPPA